MNKILFLVFILMVSSVFSKRRQASTDVNDDYYVDVDLEENLEPAVEYLDANYDESQIEALFKQYKKAFHKKYKSKENARRFEIFKENLLLINQLNHNFNDASDPQSSFMKLTKLSDMVKYIFSIILNVNIIIFNFSLYSRLKKKYIIYWVFKRLTM